MIGKYELSLNDEFVFIKEDLDEELQPMSILCHRKLKEIFPELDFEDLQQRLMSNLRYSIKDKVATCRYDLCRYVIIRKLLTHITEVYIVQGPPVIKFVLFSGLIESVLF